MSATLSIIAETPMFSLLDAEERETLAELIEEVHFKAGQTIFDLGDPGGSLYVVRTGRVELYSESDDGDKIVLGENEPGDMFGEISLLDGGSRSSTAVALEDSELLMLDRDALFDLVKQHPHAAVDVLTMVGRRLRRTDELLRTHVSRNPNAEMEESATLGQRVADAIAAFGGSWSFILIFAGILIIWVAINSFVLVKRPFDPYPFILLNLVLSMLAAMQAPVIMMSQNRQAAKDRLKSEVDYEVNLKAELEVATLHRKVDRIYEALQSHWADYEKEKKSEQRLKDSMKSPNDYY